jgi:hypothetical protein
MIRIFRAVLRLRGSRYLPAQSDPIIHEEMREAKSWIVVAADCEHLHGWRAVSVVVSDSKWFWPIGWLMGRKAVLPIGEAFYRWIERHRPMLSKLTAFMNTNFPE